MSIRIHELAKKIGMDNKQLLSLLKERKHDVKSVSSTIDNISAEAIEQEFGNQEKTADVNSNSESTDGTETSPAAGNT
jgi:translation initiation factor IF-2